MPDIAQATRTITKPARNPAPSPALRNMLKEATAADHARLDTQLGAFDLHEFAGYRRFLEANAAALLPLEGALVAGGVRNILPDWDRHARARAILGDLVSVGGAPALLDPPVLDGHPAMLGALYVLEGSRLGATYLLRHVRRAADPRIRNATAYLAHGTGQGLWQDFLAVLESHAGKSHDPADIVRSARRAFDLFSKATTQS
jgi:heme oxygenase (biliverdin-IX-beta and delta-forming)